MDKLWPRRPMLAIGVLSVLAAYSDVSAGETLQLVVDNRPNATIVLAEKPRAAAQLAAYELQYYFRADDRKRGDDQDRWPRDRSNHVRTIIAKAAGGVKRSAVSPRLDLG